VIDPNAGTTMQILPGIGNTDTLMVKSVYLFGVSVQRQCCRFWTVNLLGSSETGRKLGEFRSRNGKLQSGDWRSQVSRSGPIYSNGS
jgi:hypothetical protein